MLAYANDAEIGGVNCPTCVLPSGQISAPGGVSEVDINVNTPIGTAGTPAVGVGVYAFSTEEITVTSTQDITTTDRAIWLDSNSVTAGQGAISVTSSGAMTSTLSRGVEILQPAAEVLLDGQGTGTITGATDGVAVLGFLPGGTQEILNFSSIIGGTNSIFVDSLGADVSIQGIGQVGDASSTVDGIFIDADATPGGNIDIGGTSPVGQVQGGDDGLELYTSGAGTMTVNVGDVTGADWGIFAIGTEGDADITVTGAIEGTGDVGIETRTTTGNITIDANDVTGGTWGIYTRSTAGDTEVTAAGDVVGGTAMAIDAVTTTGNISVNGSGTATATAGDVGIWAGTGGGDVSVQDLDTVTSVDTGVYTFSAGGDITVTGVGAGGGITSSAVDGIYASTQSGDGNVTIAGNGPITAADDGIEAYSFGTGTMGIDVDADISAVDYGVYSRSTDGDMTLNVGAGSTVSAAAITGIDATATGSGATAINIANDAVVEGGAFGLVTGTLATVENAGTIGTIGDTGAASEAGTGIGLWSWTGSTEFNNSGVVLGQVHSDGDGVTFNNSAEGIWYAGTGTHEFEAVADVVSNAGTIFIRDGLTTFGGLESFVTTDGGHIDMSYSPAATDTLQVQNFSSEAGALLSFDFDALASNNAGLGHDNSEDGLGTADTIWAVGTAAPEAGTLVSVNHVNGDPAGRTGSVALVYTGITLDAPAPGDAIVSSDFYGFAAPEAFDATAFYLVDDGDGGLYYQWAPNLTTATLGAYGGGDMSDQSAATGNIASAGASFAGLGGMSGLGGGATGAIADKSASSARRGGSAEMACGDERQPSKVWAYADATFSRGSGFKGDTSGVSLGYEHDFGETAGLSCGQLFGGVFVGLGQANMSWDTGSTDSTNVTTGAYLRYGRPEGFYASGVVAVSWADADLSNAIFGSTATQKSVGYAGLGSIGYVTPVSAKGSIDWRASLSFGEVDGGSFTDSVGIQVEDSNSRIMTAGLKGTYWHDFSETTNGFIGAGINLTEAKREMTAFGVTVSGTSRSTVATVAAGFSHVLSERSSLDMAIEGAFVDEDYSVGARIGMTFEF